MKKKNLDDMTKEEKKAYEKLQEKFELVPRKQKTEKSSKKDASVPKNAFVHTIEIVKQPIYIKTFGLTALISLVLYSFLYGLWKIPIIEFGINRFSTVGILDYLYLVLISVLTGLLFTLFKYERLQSIKSGSKLAGSGGLFAGIVSAVCPVCQGVSIAALGSTVALLPLAFLVPYIGLLQIVTIFILGFSLYLKADSIFTQTCIACKVDTKL